MSINYEKTPEAFFFAPGVDPGFYVKKTPDWTWREMPQGNIVGYPISAYDHLNEMIATHIRNHDRLRKFRAPVMFNTVPIIADDVRFSHSFTAIGGKWFLNGASGTRLRNRYVWKNKDTNPQVDDDVIAHLKALHEDDRTKAPLPVFDKDIRDLDFAIDCRNTFNFYHFLTETLCQLCLLDDLDFRGDILIHSPSKGVRDFIKDWVKALFPEYKGRIKFRRSPKRYERVLSAFNMRHFYHQTSEQMMPSLDALAPRGWVWRRREADRNSQAMLAMNSCDVMLTRLRARALDKIRDMQTDHLPKRFWVARAATGNRNREMRNEDKLIEALRPHGFQVIYFEHLKPLEQVAIMANAEIMMSYHGAGFANMLFAGPQTHCIEVGNLQSALHRWGDFMPHALVSGCAYRNFFADFNTDTPDVVPSILTEGLVPVALSLDGVMRMARYVELLTAKNALPMSDAELLATTKMLSDLKERRALRVLLEPNQHRFALDPDIWAAWASCCEEIEDFEGVFDALSEVFARAPQRFWVLERLIWLTKRLDRVDLAPNLLAQHAALFPQRHDAFRSKLRWYRDVESA
ncbi:glycosyltransferase 61 family protein [Cognatishimia sp. MH4019]|uniref:glycosyltransferase 61 family protein n=1 Tax=Cognatishimia sp. MH4019 TaxID=2854030 RepID=UPI001CD4A478|nr:glycosyltransferase family 61 protein [Cognatishimia sp. MH4019]